jgi:glycosyltransferase involved in cell wall biosynthesis
MDVYWISPHPNHYHSYLLEMLRRVEVMNLYPVYLYSRMDAYPWASNFIDDDESYILRRRLGIDWALLVKLLKKKNSLIVVAGWNDPTTFLLLTFLAMLRRKFVLYSDTPNIGLRRAGILQSLRKRWVTFIYKRMWKHLVTGEVGTRALKALNISEEKVVNFPFATNTDFFAPSVVKSANEKVTFFSSGRLDIRHKGYDVIIEVLGRLKLTCPEKTFHYYIAGAGPDEKVIISLIESLRLSSDVTLLGWLEPKSLLSYYQRADFFVHASNFDPYPNAVLEAMSCGVPVIGSDAAGSVIDRVQDGFNGFVFPHGNKDELLSKLVTVLSLSTNEKDQLRKNSRETAIKWHVNCNIGQMEQIIQSF